MPGNRELLRGHIVRESPAAANPAPNPAYNDDVKRRLLAVSLFVVLLVGLAALAGADLPVASVLAQIGVIWLVLIASLVTLP